MGAKVIVVDDSATVRQQVVGVLSAAGFETIEADDGLRGLRAVEANGDAKVLICDVNMPALGGLEMISRVRALGKNPQLAVVVLTTEGDPELIKRAKAAGAKTWIVKPFRPDLLLATVRKLAGAG